MKALLIGSLKIATSLVVASVALIAFGFQEPLPAKAHAVFWGVFVLVLVLLWARPKLTRRRLISREKRDLEKLIAKHRQALVRNFRKSIKRNEYGYESAEGWSKEIERFLKSTEFKPSALSADEIQSFVTGKVESLADDPCRLTDDDAAELPKNGYDFERWCAERLRLHGWNAHATPSSGDQGIDVIAQRGPTSVGIQCKLYSNPVGNKAVQEAFSGSAFHGVDHAVVVASSGFTPQARDLAERTGVALIKPEQLPHLADFLEKPLPSS
jgi:restriction system protein